MIAKRFSISKENLERFYWHDCLSIKDIARRLNCSHRTIHVRMVECGIPRRKSGVPGPNITYSELKRFYLDQGLSSRKISKMYGCAYSTIDRKIRSAGFPVKTLAAAHITSKRKPFNGTIEDKAYLIGFRIGDLRVRKMYKNSETLLIDCGSTHKEQILLIKRLFSKYGRVWISQPNKVGKVQIECSVDLSFLFLLNKFNNFPNWSLKTKHIFFSIFSGFIDAEGCFYINKNRKFAGFSIGNYNTEILKQIKIKLTELGFHPRLFRGVKKGYTGKDGYSHREDYWILSIYRKLEVLNFASMVLPYLRHREKIKDVKKVIKNIESRNKLYGE